MFLTQFEIVEFNEIDADAHIIALIAIDPVLIHALRKLIGEASPTHVLLNLAVPHVDIRKREATEQRAAHGTSPRIFQIYSGLVQGHSEQGQSATH